MPCKVISNSTSTVIVCTRTIRCHICGKPHTSLCDATKKNGKPCDMPMRDEHRINVGPDTDVCIYHNHPKYIYQAIKNRRKVNE